MARFVGRIGLILGVVLLSIAIVCIAETPDICAEYKTKKVERFLGGFFSKPDQDFHVRAVFICRGNGDYTPELVWGKPQILAGEISGFQVDDEPPFNGIRAKVIGYDINPSRDCVADTLTLFARIWKRPMAAKDKRQFYRGDYHLEVKAKAGYNSQSVMFDLAKLPASKHDSAIIVLGMKTVAGTIRQLRDSLEFKLHKKDTGSPQKVARWIKHLFAGAPGDDLPRDMGLKITFDFRCKLLSLPAPTNWRHANTAIITFATDVQPHRQLKPSSGNELKPSSGDELKPSSGSQLQPSSGNELKPPSGDG